MSRQINFFILPDELIELEKFIKSDMGGLFILRASEISDIIIVDNIFDIPYQNGFIVPEFEFNNLTIRKINTNLFRVESFVPVIEFSQSLLRGKDLRAARLLYKTGCYIGENRVEFSKEYITWCENIFKWVKKKYKPYSEMKGYRISESVLNMVQNNELELIV
jgi:hypothetical protein